MTEKVGGFDVSRETFGALKDYQSLIQKWSPRINLVAKSTLADIWDRHICDSAQVFHVKQDEAGSWVDFGAGGGLPGIVVAILAKEKQPKLDVTLVESDQRKCAFLRTVIRELALRATVLSDRIETLDPLGANIISARALAPLPKLLDLSHRHLQPDGICLFQKGQAWKKEVADARSAWSFDLNVVESKTQTEAVILEIGDIRRD